MIHLVGLPHTSLDEDAYPACAFTTKAARWTRVLESIGEPVTCYWGGGPTTVDVDVHHVISDDERRAFFGDDVGTRLPDIRWDADADYWALFNRRAVDAVREQIQPGDMVAIWAGATQQRVVDAFSPTHTVLEPAVGYEGLAHGTFACFESYAWMHNRYGALGVGDGRAFDTVIPGFVDPADFTIGPDHGYVLFLGRVTVRKGPHVAAQAAERAGLRLVVAGAGAEATSDGAVMTREGMTVAPCDYVGPVGAAERRELLANASTLIVPTQYLEPFGTVHVEALMSGVPVVASDWGVFTETVTEGVVGHRFRTLAQAVEGLHRAPLLRGRGLRAYAAARYSPAAVAPMFDEWLWRLRSLRDGSGGWFAHDTRRRH